MTEPAIRRGDQAEEGAIHTHVRSYVRTDAEFRAAVAAGIASYDAGEPVELDSVIEDIHRYILDPS